jgi:lipopolysaccharide assembly outer membrane protein LptD (OstA)
LYELEIRHLLSKGSYLFSSSIAAKKQTIVTSNNGGIKTYKTLQRYNLTGNGNFQNNDIHYGFNLDRTSDKSFLKRKLW